MSGPRGGSACRSPTRSQSPSRVLADLQLLRLDVDRAAVETEGAVDGFRDRHHVDSEGGRGARLGTLANCGTEVLKLESKRLRDFDLGRDDVTRSVGQLVLAERLRVLELGT